MIQSLFIMSKTGEVMIEKHWRGITPRNVCDFFWDEVNRHDVPEAVPPILQVHIYLYIIAINKALEESIGIRVRCTTAVTAGVSH